MNNKECGFYSCLAAVVVSTAIVYCRVPSFQYLNWDDNVYVVQRNEIQDGLTLSGVRWAFSTFEAANWHPLVWLSFMCEIEMFGISSLAMHTTNLVLHLANTALVAILIRRLTGWMWSGLSVSALFGLHPQHVEAVAWISERKELLCVFFGLLTMLAWHENRVRNRTGLGFAAHVLFVLSLLTKQMLVTLPFLLLVIEFFPLSSEKSKLLSMRSGALAVRNISGLFLLAFAALVAAFAAQRDGGAIADVVVVPLWVRLTNAVSSVGWYLGQTFVPLGLNPFYRHPVEGVSVPFALIVLIVIAAISVLVWRLRIHPGIVAGWLWFLGTLVPVLGIVQLGAAARADRYVYFPHIGLFVLLVSMPWIIAPQFRRSVKAGFAIVAVLFTYLTFQQTAVWRDSVSLWQGSLRCDPDSYRAHEHLATALLATDHLDESVAESRVALRYPENSASSQCYLTLATALLRSGHAAESVEFFRVSIDLSSDNAVASLHLGHALREMDAAESFGWYERAYTLAPGSIECLSGLANAEARRGNFERAIFLYREARRISPTDELLKENIRIIQDAAQHRGR